MSTPQDKLVSTIAKHLDSWQLSSKLEALFGDASSIAPLA